MKSLKLFGPFFLVLFLGIFLKINNHLLLRVPKFGFVLFALAGGPIPPFIQTDIFHARYQDQWKGRGDVFATVPAKSGTTWLMNTLHHIRAKGNPEPFRDIYEEVRWAEYVYYPGQPMQERIEVLQNTAKRFPFAIYKSHRGPQDLHFRSDAKYIICVRNPVDVAASFYPFFRRHDVGYAKMWGGFPTQAGQEEGANEMSVFQHQMLVDGGNGQPFLDFVVFQQLKEFWPLRHLPNVLFVHYANRLANDTLEVQRIVDFLGLNLTEEEVKLVVHKVSFEEMKNESIKYELNHIMDDYRRDGKIPLSVKFVMKDLINVGGKRNGTQEFDVSFVERLRLHVKRTMGEEFTEWMYNGGSIPI